MLAALAGAFAGGRNVETLLALRERIVSYVGALDKLLAVSEDGAGAPLATSAQGHAGAPHRVVGRDGRHKNGLSHREAEVVRLIVSGVPVRTVGSRLSISPHTVRNHLKSCFRKLNVRSQIELVNRAHQLGLVEGP
jgi:DNA-binding CsgD family transcriptional regulator